MVFIVKRIECFIAAVFIAAVVLVPFVDLCAEESENPEYSASFGLLNGGGIVGFELERMVYRKFALTGGVGFFGFNFGGNWHFSENINSSYIHVGAGGMYVGVGGLYSEISINFRFLDFVQFSAGMGYWLYYVNEENRNRSYESGPFFYPSVAFYTTL